MASASASEMYSDLPPHIRHRPERLSLKPLDQPAKQFVSSFLRRVVSRNVPKEDGALERKLQQKALMLDTVSVPKTRKHKKLKTMSAREKKARGIYKISPENQKFEMYLPLHKLWTDYIQDVLQLRPNDNLKNAYPKLLKADYHGCHLTVSRSKCPSYVGTSGIVIQETKNVFKIITAEDKLKTIPKAANVFTFECQGFVFTLHGNHFRFRPSERSARKFKYKPTVDL